MQPGPPVRRIHTINNKIMINSDSQHNPITLPAGKTKYLLIGGFTASLLILVILAAVGLSFMYNVPCSCT